MRPVLLMLLKDLRVLRRTAARKADRATLTEHFVRHGNVLTHISIVTDPVYLTEPLIKTQNFGLNDRVQNGNGAWLWPCEYVDEVANRPQGVVPNYLVGKNPMVVHTSAGAARAPIAALRHDRDSDTSTGAAISTVGGSSWK